MSLRLQSHGHDRNWFVWEYGVHGIYATEEAAQAAYARVVHEAQRAGMSLVEYLGRPNAEPPKLVAFASRTAARAYAMS